MKALFVFVAVLASLSLASAYSIDGRWKLTLDDSYSAITDATDVTFDFEKVIKNGQITNQLIVFACDAVIFNYIITDNQVNFVYDGILPRP